ncbi:T9SS type A sorting domain-containing protein [Mariniflexile sp.]|uniref:T9SS type A sorting domain-containing protein n=1 Tax=Mariniflexile sp. TaxID=1979402 RepID=UPI00404795CA
MKTKLYIFIALFITLKALAQPEIAWQKIYGSTIDDYAYAIEQTLDGGYVMAGYASGSNGDVTNHHGNRDFWVVKTDASGNLQWQKALGGSITDVAFSINQTTDNGYIVAGHTNSSDGDITESFGREDIWVVKLDDLGNLQWQKSYGDGNAQRAFSIVQTKDGGYVLAGYTFIGTSETDAIVIKLDAIGNVEWQNNYRYDNNSSFDEAQNIKQTIDGGYIVVGSTNPYENLVNTSDFWVLKLDAQGNVEWDSRLGGSGVEEALDVQQLSDASYIVVGFTFSNDGDITGNHGQEDYWIVKLDTTGNLEWQKTMGGTETDRAFSVRETIDGGYIVSGYTESNDGDITNAQGSYDGWIVKLDTTGNLQWQKILGGTQSDFITSIIQTTDDGYITIGETSSDDSGAGDTIGGHDFWIVKFEPETLGINSPTIEGFVSIIYPNPTSNYINIKSEITITKIEIFDLLGKQILTTGTQNQLDVSGFQAGIYLIKLYSENRHSIKKIVIK